jgi:hypothetical protein
MKENTARRMARWPLFLIAAPAAAAVWSGWVGLGQLSGFGIIHPLPGIWDSAKINTAITLPVGVEAYGAYALGAWLTPGTSDRARTFAKRSAIGSLGLGMAGQVIYHLLAAAHAARAPWPVVTLVSCLPVVALAFGAALAHLLHAEPDEAVEADTPQAARAIETVVGAPEPAPAPAPETATAQDEPESVTVAGPRRIGMTLDEAALEFAGEVEAGELPSLRQIRARAHTGGPRAQAIQAHLGTLMRARQIEPVGALTGGQARATARARERELMNL